MFKALCGVSAFVLVCALGLKTPLLNNVQKQCTVTSKESVALSEGGHQYRVYTSDCGTYVIEDSFVWFRFNSADLYGKIIPHQSYMISSGGLRVPFLNVFPNIKTITPTKKENI